MPDTAVFLSAAPLLSLARPVESEREWISSELFSRKHHVAWLKSTRGLLEMWAMSPATAEVPIEV